MFPAKPPAPGAGGGGGGGGGGGRGGYVEAPEEAGAAPQREPRAGLLLTFIMMLG